MAEEPPEFEVLLKHVDRAGTRAVDGHEEDAPVVPEEKRPMKPEVVAPNAKPPEGAIHPDNKVNAWLWILIGILIAIATSVAILH